jgi:hypothetical protein
MASFFLVAGAAALVTGATNPADAAGKPKPPPADTYTVYRTTADGGEPTIGYDTARDAAVYGAGTDDKRLSWNDSTVPATMTVAPAKAGTSLTTLDAITFTDQNTNRTFVSQLAAASGQHT